MGNRVEVKLIPDVGDSRRVPTYGVLSPVSPPHSSPCGINVRINAPVHSGWSAQPWLQAAPAAAVGLLVAIVGLLGGNVSSLFKEGGLVTHGSALLLVACAVAAIHAGWGRPGTWRWAVLGAGFVFLLCDEVLQLHERTDAWLHVGLGIRENAWTDRIDDAIVIGYGLATLTLLVCWRHHLIRLLRQRRLLLTAAAWFAAMAALDLASNSYSAGVAQRFSSQSIAALATGSTIAEETCKLSAEWSLLLALIRCRPDTHATTSVTDDDHPPTSVSAGTAHGTVNRL